MKKLPLTPAAAASLISAVTGQSVLPVELADLVHGEGREEPVRAYQPDELRQAHGLILSERSVALSPTSPSIANQQIPPVIVSHYAKGGSGKTTAASNIAIAMASQGLRVLYIDSDPQGTSTELFGIDIEGEGIRTLKDVMFGHNGVPVTLAEAIIPLYENATLDLLPSDIAMSNFDLQAFSQTRRETLFKRFLEHHRATLCRYDLILIDTNPASNFLNMMLMYPAPYILMTVSLDVLSMKSMRLMASELQDLIDQDAPSKEIMLVANRFHPQMTHSRESMRRLLKTYPEQLLSSAIPEYAGIARQGWEHARGLTLMERDPTSIAAKRFTDLAIEIAERVLWRPRGLGKLSFEPMTLSERALATA